jgi:hypothetical protein
MRTIIQMLIDGRVATEGDIRGCSDEEIERLETHYNVRLPQSYRDFLHAMGHRAGEFFGDNIEDIYYDRVFGLRERAEEVLEDNDEPFRLPEDAFVFAMHEGYIFLYFRISKGDDPPVYIYKEDGPPQELALSFYLFLYDIAEQFSR